MEFTQLIQTRKSIRGYLQKPVPREVIEEIIEVAKWAPSSVNTQPWHVHVVTGEPLDRIRKGNTENMVAGVHRCPTSRRRNRMKVYIANARLISRCSSSTPWESLGKTRSGVWTGSCAVFDNLMRRYRLS